MRLMPAWPEAPRTLSAPPVGALLTVPPALKLDESRLAGEPNPPGAMSTDGEPNVVVPPVPPLPPVEPGVPPDPQVNEYVEAGAVISVIATAPAPPPPLAEPSDVYSEPADPPPPLIAML